MSYHTLQRLTVRLLFDPLFVERLYTDPDTALEDLDLTESERRQLLSVDKRAWGYDALRRRRTLRTLVEEFKVSSTMALAETRSIASLEAFFSSDRFHTSVEQRGSMAMAFASFLLDMQNRGAIEMPQFADVLRLETTTAKCRRSLQAASDEFVEIPSTINDTARVQLAPGCDVGRFQGKVIETIQRVEQYLFEVSLMPAMALCDDAPRLDRLPEVDTQKSTYLLFTPGANGITLVNISRYDYLLLYEARKPITLRELLQRAKSAGVSNNRAQRIVSEALEERTLILL